MKLANLTNRTKSRITLAILFLLFEAGIFAISKLSAGLRLDPFTWVLLVFAAAFGGSAIAYMSIGDWIRWLFTKEVPHSSNSSMIEIEPKYEGWMKSVGLLLCCPICAGTWVGAALLGLLTIDYNFGYYTVIVMSAGGALRVIVRLSEMLEWQSRYAQERTAELNRRNAIEEALKNAQMGEQTGKDSLLWIVQDNEVKSD
jgi:hypothetical protein